MTVLSHPNVPATQTQAAALLEDAWTSEIVPRLPSDLDAQAHHLRAFVRVRGLACPADLLRAVLISALDLLALPGLASWAVLIGLADISCSAWRKRLRLARAWLLWLLQSLLSLHNAKPAPFSRRVRLIDATCLAQHGHSGDAWRLHWDFDLMRNQLSSVVLTDRTKGEYLEHFTIEPGDILVADGGYGYRRNLAYASKAQADVVLRFSPNTFPLEHRDGSSKDLIAWLQAADPNVVQEWSGFCRWEGKRYGVRVVAVALPAAQAEEARRRCREKAKRKGRNVQAATLLVAGWILVLTTLEEQEWPGVDVLRLYRARWQIELVFKRLKGFLATQALRKQGKEASEAQVYGLLLAWTLQEDGARLLREALSGTPEQGLSSWRLAALSLATLRQQVRGQWNGARVEAVSGRLERFVRSTPRKRVHQETALRDWLSARLTPDPSPLLR